MKNPKVYVDRLISYREQSLCTDVDFGEQLGRILPLVHPEEVSSLMERVPQELIPFVRKGLLQALDQIADDECLRPHPSPFSGWVRNYHSEYHQSISTLLLEPDEYGRQRGVLSFVCLPSFEPEWSLRLFGSVEKGFRLRAIEAKTKILAARDNASVECASTDVALPDDLGSLLCDVWRAMLLRTRYPKRFGVGRDGVNYHFETHGGGVGFMSGKTWSPRPDTAPGKLVELCSLLLRYTKADEASRPKLLDEIRELGEWLRAVASSCPDLDKG